MPRETLSLMGGEIWAERESPWIAVADQEPPFDVTILVTDGYRPEFARYERGALGTPRKFVERHGWQLPGVTHWLPIPPLPTVTA